MTDDTHEQPEEMAEQQNSRFVVRKREFVIPRDPGDREETSQRILLLAVITTQLLAGFTWRTYGPGANVRAASH
ncbi:hypothetical protein N7530_006938 [Penicillium desertorum]|uniref:Uncharacterized protein n=1 Tax=Penicillium desertorum TaxID=1303715 RepID=A0A9W9WTD0_9EURO|nr:hypothetical protein N7530_006938 [Penicillium desertorum]